MLEVFPVDMPAHHIVQSISIGALLAVVHRELLSIAQQGLVYPHTVPNPYRSSVRAGRTLAHHIVRHMEEPDMGFQSPLVPTVCAIGAVKKDSALKIFSVNIAEVVFVGREILGGKRAI